MKWLLLLSFITLSIRAQNISYLKIMCVNQYDSPVSGVAIQLNGSTAIQKTDKEGAYTFLLENQRIDMRCSGVGLIPQQRTFLLNKDTVVHVLMYERYKILESVEVEADRINPLVSSDKINVKPVKSAELNDLGMIGGEIDIIRALTFQASTFNFNEGRSEILVRGGFPGQNKYLYNGIQIFPTGHLFGMVSSINAYSVDAVDFYRGIFPPAFGNKVASVVDMYSDNAVDSSHIIHLNAGVWSLNASAKIPINNQYEITAGFRKSITELYPTSPYKILFSDLFIEQLYKKDKMDLKLSIYNTSDYLEEYFYDDNLINGQDFTWRNSAIGLQTWNYLNPSTIFRSNTYYTFFSNRSIQYATIDSTQLTNIIDNTIMEFSNTMDLIKDFGSHELQMGIETYQTALRPRNIYADIDRNVVLDASFFSLSPFVNFQLRYQTIDIDIGIRMSNYFSNLYNWMPYIEPRFSFRKTFKEQAALVWSYTRSTQPINLLTNTGFGVPNDVWILNEEVSTSDLISLDYISSLQLAKNIPLNFQVSLYYRWNNEIVDFLDGGSVNELFQSSVFDRSEIIGFGYNRTHGLELAFDGQYRNINYLFNYTYMNSRNRIEGINEGDYYPSLFDAGHSISSNISARLSRKWSARLNFFFHSGRPYTKPESINTYAERNFIDYTLTTWEPLPVDIVTFEKRNHNRMMPYHRMDLIIERAFMLRRTRFIQGKYFLSIYNLYNRQNPFYYVFENNELKSISVFPIIPSLNISFTFNKPKHD